MTNILFTFMATIVILSTTNWTKTTTFTNNIGRFEVREGQRVTNHVIIAPYHGTEWRFNLETNVGPKIGFRTNTMDLATNSPAK